MVSGQETLSVVIPTWRGREHLAALLPSLTLQSRPAQEILVIDGSSQDGSRELCESFGVRFIALERNAGFAHAVNRGLALAKGEFVAVLNNDIRLHADWFSHMLAAQAPFACGKVLQWDRPTHLDATWDLVSQSGVPLRCGHGKPDGQFWNRPRQIDLAPWTAVLLRRDYFNAVGRLDESLESYLEDVDYGLRGAALGFRGAYVPRALAWHRGSSTLGEWHPRQVRLSSRNQARIVAKHGGDFWKAFIGQSLWGIAAARHGRGGDWLLGKWEAWRRSDTSAAKPKQSQILEHLEREIFALESATGMGRFWRYYWTLL
jgi:GT2 family glycosyltransferase